ncbi:hypothetical protein ABQJ54_01090 [Rhodanobacter sp. Si-c]|uniref:Uncharacterized protein n=1 Tax=Rhodanobacter lycopersici TaxID=3162487 RepID=A0ABV3Q9E3_9GAMM
MADALWPGQRFRTFKLNDDHGSLRIEIDKSMGFWTMAGSPCMTFGMERLSFLLLRRVNHKLSRQFIYGSHPPISALGHGDGLACLQPWSTEVNGSCGS